MQSALIVADRVDANWSLKSAPSDDVLSKRRYICFDVEPSRKSATLMSMLASRQPPFKQCVIADSSMQDECFGDYMYTNLSPFLLSSC